MSQTSLIKLSFGYSSSHNYQRACKIISQIANNTFDKTTGIHSCSFDNILDFLDSRQLFDSLLKLVINWKSTLFYVFGDRIHSEYYQGAFAEKNTGVYWPLFKPYVEGVSDRVAYENLPLRFVHYPESFGAFWGFSETIDGEIFFCECCRKPIENYLKLRKLHPLNNYRGPKSYPLGTDAFPMIVANRSKEWTGDITKYIHYKKGLCFRCNGQVPRLCYCAPMYGSKFMQHYGWYIKQEYLRLGVDYYSFDQPNIIKDECPPEIYNKLIRYYESDISDRLNISKNIERLLEDNIREQFGYKKIGNAWVSETLLYDIIVSLFPNMSIVRHYRPKWLEGLEIDIYVQDINLGFEYQGQQHYQPVEHWGGHDKLIIQQEHDARKAKICKEKGVKLICISYEEPLTAEYIKAKVNINS